MFIHVYTPLAGGQENHLQSKGFLGRAFGAYESGYRLVLLTHFLAKFTFLLCYPQGSHSPFTVWCYLPTFVAKFTSPFFPLWLRQMCKKQHIYIIGFQCIHCCDDLP